MAYSSPKLGNFTLNGSIYLDDTEADEHDVNVGMAYRDKRFTAGFQYIAVGDTGVIANSTPDSSAIRLHGEYKFNNWTVAASLESIDLNYGDKQRFIYLASTYRATEKTQIAASYGKLSDVSSTDDGKGFNIAVYYKLLEKTKIYALVSQVSLDDNAEDERSTIALGVSHKFSF